MASGTAPAQVSIVHDWLVGQGGSERVLEAMLEVMPQARVHTLVYDRGPFAGSSIASARVRTSFLDRLPGGAGNHRHLLPLMPFAVEQFDVSGSELVISNSCAVSHGVLTGEGQLHVAYLNRTMTYAWDTYHRDLAAFGVGGGPRGMIARVAYHYIRQWDYLAFQRPDVLVANSAFSRRRIAKHYRREATVIHPPVDRLPADGRVPADHYVFVGRLVPVKRVELLVRAFNELDRPLVIVGDGPAREALETMAGRNVQFVGRQPRDAVARYVASARAFVFASEEDFGIAPVEAQMLGIPVIAFDGGGTAETIVPGTTGLLYQRQEASEIVSAVRQFEAQEHAFEGERIAEHAAAFSSGRFRRELADLVDRELDRHRRRDRAPAIPEP